MKTDQLETVIPREDNSHIMIVSGQYKKEIAEIKDRNKNKEQVTVQLLSDRSELLTLDYDSVCHYVGDVNHLLEY